YIAAGVTIALVREVGYRQFAYPATLSRDLENQTSMYRALLGKHDPADVATLFSTAGHDERSTAWGMVSFLTSRRDFALALASLCTEAMERFPAYRDARANLQGPSASRLSLHPLRREPVRRVYGV